MASDIQADQPHDQDEGSEQGDYGTVTSNPLDLPAAPKKKKKKRKPASKRGLGAPTGMETFFADSPITPAEFAERQKLYDPEIPFLDRLLTAIEKFEQTRRLLPERRDAFYKWLHYGGIKVGVNPFSSGLDESTMDKDDIATAKSKVRIPDDVREALESVNTDDPTYAVDFLSCTRAFLSYRVLATYYFAKREDVSLITTTIERFMDYLMQHDVCPEYAPDILATRTFCREAVDKLWSAREAQQWLPGDFNVACSTLFGGNYSKMYDGKTYWGELQPGESAFVGFTPEEATQIVGLGIAGAAPEDIYTKYADLMCNEPNSINGDENDQDTDTPRLAVTQTITNAGFEIIAIYPPTQSCKEMYKTTSTSYRPVGLLLAKSWTNPLSPPEDLTDSEKEAAQLSHPHTGLPNQHQPPKQLYTFFVEEIIQQYLSPGQKLVANIHKLNCDVWFFDEFAVIYPEYELWLPNDLVEEYKVPRMVPGAYLGGREEQGEGEGQDEGDGVRGQEEE